MAKESKLHGTKECVFPQIKTKMFAKRIGIQNADIFSSKPDSRIQYIPSMIFFRHPVRLLAGKSLVSLMRTYIKKRGAGLSPVPRFKGSRIAQFVETSNVESPTPRVYIKPLATSTDVDIAMDI